MICDDVSDVCFFVWSILDLSFWEASSSSYRNCGNICGISMHCQISTYDDVADDRFYYLFVDNFATTRPSCSNCGCLYVKND